MSDARLETLGLSLPAMLLAIPVSRPNAGPQVNFRP